MEFWARWNTYLGDWLRRHVFFPVVMFLRRRRRRRSATPAVVVGVLAVFTTIGILHAAVPIASRSGAGGAAFFALVLVFLVHGTALLVWEAVRRRSQRILPSPEIRPRFRRVTAFGSWLMLRQLNAVLAWVAIPAMARGMLPPELSRMW
jgi:D-alanyl-lipoteichoic acid acyltransferase DltB (MBOAT superfamily)